jgi:hypothetical protein
MHIGKILFNLIILWKYLGCPPENDLDIFELVKNDEVT